MTLPQVKDEPQPTSGTGLQVSASSGDEVQSIKIDIDPGLKARGFCDAHALSITALVQVAWGVVLRSYTASNNVCFGYVTPGHIGDTNSQVCVVDMANNVPVLELLQQGTRGSFWTNSEEATQSFDTVIIHNTTVGKSDGMDYYEKSKCKIVVEIHLNGEGIIASLNYHSPAFEQANYMANEFSNAVSQITREAEKPVSSLDLCSRHDLDTIAQWNRETPPKSNDCVNIVISRQCFENPDDVAVTSWDGDFTYNELDRLSTTVAKRLAASGVRPETFVPLCFEKTKWAIVAILGVIKTGGAYVLLDPAYPLDRIRSICKSVKTELVMASTKNSRIMKELAPQVITVGQEIFSWPQAQDGGPGIISTQPTPHNALYAVFTSGSTGVPKGVVIEHAAFCAAAKANKKALSLDRNSKVLQFASFAYDVANRDILFTLMFGGTICLPSDSDRSNDIVSFIKRSAVNWASISPSVAGLISPESVPSLRCLLLGGEPMTAANVALWADKVHLMNAYGPCECAAVSSLQSKVEVDSDHRNIGRGTGPALWIVDMDNPNQLLPIGATGELVIESASVGRGYINDQEGTSSPFLESTTWLSQVRSAGSARRLYRTGDLARYNTNGTLNFLGRKDSQIKIHGQRVELMEVEYRMRCALAELRIQTNDVTVGLLQGPRLAAFIEFFVPDDEKNDDIFIRDDRAVPYLRPIEERLSKVLPRHMIPSIVIPTRKMPLNMAGKKDRKRLLFLASKLSPSEIQIFYGGSSSSEAPANEIEKRLHLLWAKILHREPQSIGRHDSFFRCGGDSIAGMKLVTAAREEGIELTVADLFAHPKLLDLAPIVRQVTKSDRPDIRPFGLVTDKDLDKVRRLVIEQCEIDGDQIEDIYPCTAMQEGLIALTAKDQRMHILQSVYELPRQVDITRFQLAWGLVIEKNPILRTRIVQSAALGTFQAVIKGDIYCQYHNELDMYLDQDRSTPMRIGQPLIRLAITRKVNSDEHHFVLTMHHAIFDGWSLPLVLKQLESAYLGGNPLPYRRFSPFIDHVIQSQHDSADFWRSEFTAIDAVPFPSLPSMAYVPWTTRIITRGIALEPRQVGEGDEFTISTKLRLAWAIILSLYTNRKDVVFGVTSSGRSAPVEGVEQMTGPTIATVPLRVQLQHDQLVKDALGDLQARYAGMIRFEQFGLRNISRLGKETEAACQFQSLLVVQPAEDESNTILKYGQTTTDESKYNSYAIMLSCHLGVDIVNVKAAFDENVVTELQMRRILDSLASTTMKLHSNMSDTLAEVSTISPEDITQLERWNGSVPEAEECCVHELISKQCMARPEAPAICAWDGGFTYQELDTLSSKLARYLTNLGVGPEVIVSLCFEKSKWTTVAILSVMKAGGAFLLLDPSHPSTRLEKICASAEVTFVLCSAQNTAKAAGLAATVVPVSDDESAWRGIEGHWKSPIVQPHNALYAVFTSGSTGEPKGVVIEHRAFCTGSLHHSKALCLTSESRVFQFSSYAFDVSIADTVSTLLNGGCLCVPSETDRGGLIENAINKLRANWADLTPSVARILRPDDIPGLKTVVHGGETRNGSDIRMWEGHAKVFNLYGPAECSVVSTVQSCSDGDANNIGFATGSACWVVDQSDHTRLVPIGVVGELLIEGPIVGRGYINQPQKSEEAFIQSPRWLAHFRQNNFRLYKTGDLVRYNDDGSLQMVGRKDTQIKINGQRIELGEIEHHVHRCFPGARQTLVEVIVPVDESARPLLVAFILARDSGTEAQGQESALESSCFATVSQEFQSATLKTGSELNECLPGYMVPRIFVPLRYLPMSGTGKTDRRAIKMYASQLTRMQLEAYTVDDSVEKRAPTTETEMLLQRIIAETIGMKVDRIGLDDSFFRLGGDSITAMKLVGHARDHGLVFTVPDVFLHPKLSDLARTAQQISHNDLQEIIQPFSFLKDEAVRKHVRETATKQCAVSVAEIDDIYPCTAMQEGLMALTAMRPGAYMGQYTFKFPSNVAIGDFQRAWEAVYQANPILRTRIVHVEGQGMFQVVLRERISWESHDLPMEAELGGPLVRLCFSEVADGFQFIMTLHHALYDGLSLLAILKQVKQAYKGHTLPDRPFTPFIKYIEHLDSENADSFWRLELSDLDAVPFPTLPSATYKPAPTKTMLHFISQLPSGSVKDTTLSTRVRLAWALVLALYTASDDVVFGATVSGRNAPVTGIDTITGPAITTVPLRIHIQGNMVIEKALQAIQSKAMTMIPFEQMGLQRIGRLGAEPATACRFQSLLVMQTDQEEHSLNLLGQRAQHPDNQEAFYTYALTVLCEPSAESLKLRAVFDEKVLPEGQIKLILSQFAHFIQQISSHPGRTMNEIDLISAEDLALLGKWNKNQPVPSKTTADALIARNCISQPEADAVHAWDGNLTYRELDELSSHLAMRLRKLGVEPGTDTFIPLCFEKSKWTTVAMLGTVKAGAAFVLLDPSHPQKRLQDMCREVGASIIVSSRLQTGLSADLAATVVPLPSVDTTCHTMDRDGLGTAKIQSKDALYAVFTSGSTGRPKGIIIEHESFCTGAEAQIKALKLDCTSRVFQFASYAFDVSIADNLTTLIAGGCVCVPSEADRHNDIPGAMTRLQVNSAPLTPSVARLLNPENTKLKRLMLAGEPMSPADIEAWAAKTQLVNMYGPAECSVFSTIQPRINPESDPRNIGHAIGSASWIVKKDDRRKLVPIGAVGELVIQGPIVGRGYINNKEKTADVFFDNPPWATTSSDRFYKTGDLVRYALDGSISYIGRKDTQIKISGQRMELGEIEHHVCHQFKGAQDVVVEGVIRQSHEHPMLMAFIWCGPSEQEESHAFTIPSQQFKAEAHRVESALHEVLPAYMIPNVFIPLSQIPLSLSGKVNRRYIREQAAQIDLQIYNSPDMEKEKPSTDAERVLQQAWAKILNIDPDHIGVEDSFFRLGGDSITAMQVSAQLRAMAGVSVAVSDIFLYKTISRIAQHMHLDDRCLFPDIQDAESANQPTDVEFELSPIQQMLFEYAPQGHNHFNQSFFLRVVRGSRIEAAEMTQALDSIVAHHSMLRARFSQGEDGRWAQRIISNDKNSYHYDQHELLSWTEVNSIVATSQSSLDIQRGPVFRVDLMTVGDEKEQYVSLVAHHLVIDLVSWRIILGDLEQLLSSQTSSIAQHPSLSFQRWCRLQEDYSRDNLRPETALPFTVPHPPKGYWGVEEQCNAYSEAVQEEFIIESSVTDTLFGGANHAMNTQPVEIFQAALLYSFIRTFQDRSPPAIFSEGHGREPWDAALDISRTVGWFTTMFPIFIAGSNRSDLFDIIRQTKDARRRIVSNGWAYFASRYLNPEGKKAFSDHFPIEILFNYLGLYQQLERPDAVLQQANKQAIEDSDIASDVPRFSLIEVSVSVVGGRLRFNFIYNQHMKHQDAIRNWIVKCEKTLREAAETLLHSKQQYTLTDFRLLPLTYTTLEQFIKQTLPGLGLSAAQVEDAYPCSPMQQGILLSQSLNAEHYRTRLFWRATSYNSRPVDPERLMRAWKRVVHYHPILRTVLVQNISQPGVFDQVVLKEVDPDVYVSDEAEGPYTPPYGHGRGQPPYRLTIYPGKEYIKCELEINHALIDGASTSLLRRDLALAYDGKLPSRHGPLYSDYIAYLGSLSADPAGEYWKEYLNGAYQCNFPKLNTRREATNTNSLHSLNVDLSLDLRKLHEFSETHELTLSNLFQVVWGLVLQCYTGSDTVCFGYLASCRDIPVTGAQDTIGPFINMLVCRMDLEKGTPIISALQKNQADYAKSLTHQHCSLADILRSSSASPGQSLFNTAMSLQRDTGKSGYEQSSIRVDHVRGDDPTEFDITLHVTVKNSGVVVSFNYWSSVLSDIQAKQVANTFSQIVSEIVARPNDAVGDLNVISRQDTAQIQQWVKEATREINSCIQDLIHQRVVAQQHAPAVCAWDGNLSYGELDQLSSKLAVHLINLGMGPGDFIPLCFEKSRWTTVAILGVIKAGAAFVLLDPSHPLQRLQGMCEDVQASLIVASTQTRAMAAILTNMVIVIDEDDSKAWQENKGDWQPGLVDPKTPAYVAYTSGSTGKPKGAIIPHTALTTSASAQSTAFSLDHKSRALQFASYAFDISIADNLTTLLAGACVCVPSERDRKSNLVKAANDLQINWANLTPSLVRILNPKDLPKLKTLVLAGEAMQQTDVMVWAPHVRVINAYGPVECSIISTVQSEICASSGEDPSNIGYAIGSNAWIVDKNNHHRLVPIGAVGELIIHGPIVGDGYINKSNAAFISNPKWASQFRLEGADRMYKTGDLVRYSLSDGSISYIGRKDTQVKVRGQRIELGEIEHHIRQAFGAALDVVADVVTLTEYQSHPILIAFIWCGQQDTASDRLFDTPTPEFLSEALQAESVLHDSLPIYMVPNTFIPLTRVPLTPSGKVDRRYLHEKAAAITRQEMQSYNPSISARHKQKPLSKTERILQQIWAQILNMEVGQIGVEDSFFRLGGDSITAMQMSARLKAAGFSTTVAEILRWKTISRLAQHMQLEDSPIAPVMADEQTGIPFELSPIQQMFFEHAPSGYNHFNQSFFLRCTRRIAISDLKKALDSITERHSMLRATFHETDGTWTQVVQRNEKGCYKLLEHSLNTVDEVKDIISKHQKSLDITTGPVFRVDLINMKDCQYISLIAHHLVIDLVSWRIIFADLEELLVEGVLSGLQTMSFQSWCKMQAEYSHCHLPPAKALPFDILPMPSDYWGSEIHQNTHADVLHCDFSLDQKVTNTLFGDANNTFGTQPVDIFQSALLLSFIQTFADRPAPTIFNEGHGREPWDAGIDLTRTVGWFTTIWPTHVQTDNQANHTIPEILRRVKDARMAVPGNGWSYFVSRYLNPEGKKAFGKHMPMEILFNYLGLYQQLERPGSLLESTSWMDSDEVSPHINRFSLIEVSVFVHEGTLNLRCSYNRHMRHQNAICQWISACQQSLEEAAEILPKMERGYTLQDFPLLNLTYTGLDSLIDRVKKQESSVVVTDIEDALPCSPMQQLMLRSQRRRAGYYSPSQIYELKLRDSGSVDIGNLQIAWQVLVDRHAALRTIFVCGEQEDYQVVLKTATTRIRKISCDDDAHSVLRAQSPPDYFKGGLLHQLTVCQTMSGQVFIKIDISHAITDAASLSILFREWCLAYEDQLSNSTTPLYSTYIAGLLRTSTVDTQYWKEYLTDMPPCFFPVANSSSHELGKLRRVDVDIELDLASRLHDFCRDHDTTVPALIKAVWAVVLHHFVKDTSNSVCFGYLTSGRHESIANIENIVGALVNLLACRIHIEGNSSYSSILSAMQEDYHNSLPQHAGAIRAMDELGLLPPSQHIFNTLVNHRKHNEMEPGGISFECVSGEDAMEFDIVLQVDERGKRVSVCIDYWNGRITDEVAGEIAVAFNATVARFMDDFE